MALVLSGCFGAGLTPDADGGAEPVTPDFSQVDVQFMADNAITGINGVEGPSSVYTDATNFAQDGLGWFYILQDWTPDSPSSYLYMDEWPEVTWANTGDVWCWIITAAGETEDTVIEICMTPVDLDLSVEITVTAPDVLVTIAGTISQDGSEGNLSMNSDSTTTTYGWAPATDPNYDWRFVSTITAFDPQFERFVTEKLTVETISSGAYGEFSYVRDEGTQDEFTNSGVWGQ